MKFGKEELKKGTDREMEHTDSRKEAAKIAKDHLKEKPDYYTKLDKCIPESKQEKTHVVIGNKGRGSQTLWPKSEAPELYTKDEADSIVTKMNGKPGLKFGPTQIHWHTKHIDVSHKHVNSGQPAWKGLSKLKDLDNIDEESIQELSQDTLKSYKKKATNDASSAYRATHAAFDNDDEAGVKKNDRDWRKRSKGLKMVDKKIVKEGVNGEHGPGDDEDSLDRIERKKQEKSRKAAAKVKAIKKQMAEAMLGGEKYKGKENPNNKKYYGFFDIAKKHNAKERAEVADDKHRELGSRAANSKPRTPEGKAEKKRLVHRHSQGASAADRVHPDGTTGFHR